MDKITVVVPIYNVENYLSKCIESIIRQSYRNLDIILVNDGSTDNSKTICENYVKGDNRIRLINKKNGGLSSARNVGIKNAEGKYICFIDSDDYIDTDMIETLYKYANNYDADIVECGSRWIYDDKYVNYSVDKIVICNNIEALECFFDSKCFTAVAWNKLYKTELFNNIKYPESCLHEDIGTTYKLLYKSKKLISLNTIKYNYIQRNSSISYMNFTEKHLDVLKFWEEIYELIKDINNKKLEEKCLRNIINFNVMWYEKAKLSNVKSKKILNSIRYFSMKYILKILFSRMSVKQKLKVIIFVIFPNSYMKLNKILLKNNKVS